MNNVNLRVKGNVRFMSVLLQKSRSNGGRRNHREVGGWFQQACRFRLEVTAEEVSHQGGVRCSKEQEDLLRINPSGLRPVW